MTRTDVAPIVQPGGRNLRSSFRRAIQLWKRQQLNAACQQISIFRVAVFRGNIFAVDTGAFGRSGRRRSRCFSGQRSVEIARVLPEARLRAGVRLADSGKPPVSYVKINDR